MLENNISNNGEPELSGQPISGQGSLAKDLASEALLRPKQCAHANESGTREAHNTALFKEISDDLIELSLRWGQAIATRDKLSESEFGDPNEIERQIAVREAKLQHLFDEHNGLQECTMRAMTLAEQKGKQFHYDSDMLAVELNNALRGVPNIDAVAFLLSDRDEFELKLIKDAYRRRFDTELITALGAFKGNRYSKTIYALKGERKTMGQDAFYQYAKHMLEGNYNAASADSIFITLSCAKLPFVRRDVNTVAEIFRRANKKSSGLCIKAIEDHFNQHWAERLPKLENRTVKNLDTALSEYYKGKDLEILQAHKEGKEAKADAILLRDALNAKSKSGKAKVDWVLVCNLIEGDKKSVAALHRAFCNMSELGLKTQLFLHHLRDKNNPRILQALALLDCDTLSAQAAKLRAGILKMDGEWVGEVFCHKDEATRKAIIKRYEEMFDSDFDKDLEKLFFRKDSLQIMKDFIRTGDVPPEDLLRDMMIGAGADKKGLKKTVREYLHCFDKVSDNFNTKFQRFHFSINPLKEVKRFVINTAKALRDQFTCRGGIRERLDRFAEHYLIPRDLLEDLKHELSGEDYLDIKRMLKDPISDYKSVYKELVARYKLERSGAASRFVDYWTPEGAAMDRDYQRACEYYEEITNQNRIPSRVERERFKALAQLASNAFTSFRETKNQVGFVSANLVSVTTLTAASVLYNIGVAQGLYPEFLLDQELVAFGSSLLGRLGARYLIQGRGFGRWQAGYEGGWSGIDGCVPLITEGSVPLYARAVYLNKLGMPVISKFITSQIGKRAVKMGSKLALRTAYRKLHRERESQYLRYLHAPKEGMRNLHPDEETRRKARDIFAEATLYFPAYA